MIRAVLFDLDGLMVDTEPIHFRAFRTFMQAYGVVLPESVMQDFIGYNEIENIHLLRERYQLKEPLEELVRKRRAIYTGLLETLEIPAMAGFWELSDEIRRQGMQQAVVSSSARPHVELPLRRLCEARPACGAPHAYFAAIVCGDEVTATKPAPEIYLLALERLGVCGQEAIALEDTPAGVAAAAAAEIPVYAVPNQYTRHLRFPGAAGILAGLAEATRLVNCDKQDC